MTDAPEVGSIWQNTSSGALMRVVSVGEDEVWYYHASKDETYTTLREQVWQPSVESGLYKPVDASTLAAHQREGLGTPTEAEALEAALKDEQDRLEAAMDAHEAEDR